MAPGVYARLKPKERWLCRPKKRSHGLRKFQIKDEIGRLHPDAQLGSKCITMYWDVLMYPRALGLGDQLTIFFVASIINLYLGDKERLTFARINHRSWLDVCAFGTLQNKFEPEEMKDPDDSCDYLLWDDLDEPGILYA